MSVEIIQVGEPQGQGWTGWAADWGGWAWDKAKERPYVAAVLAVPATVVAAPLIATTTATVGAGIAGGAVVAAIGEAVFGPHAAPPVTLYSVEKARQILDVHGQPLTRHTTYIRLPRKTAERTIVKASDFHTYVMSQKVAEIIAYMRAETRLKSLKVLIRSSDRKHAVVGGELEKVSASVSTELERRNQHSISATYDERVKMPHLPNYVWISDFPEVIAATRNARNGTMSFSQATDMSFGMSGSVAKFANFKAGWLSTFVLEVEATFA